MASQKNTQAKKATTPASKSEKQEKQEKTLTPKQAAIKAGSLLRGIDNSTVAIKKHQEIIEHSIEQVKSIVAGIGNQVVAQPAASKPTPASKAKSTTKKDKPAKPAKATVAKKASTTPPKAAQKPAQAQSQSPGTTIKDAAIAVLKENGGVMKASEIWHKAQEKFKRTWSRQVLYNAFDKNPDIFVQAEGGYKYGGVAKQVQVTTLKQDDKDVDSFIARASKNEAVSNVL